MELTKQPLSTVMTLNPAFCASIAQARPVGPAPMTMTSACMLGRGRSCGLGNVSGINFVDKAVVLRGQMPVEDCRFEHANRPQLAIAIIFGSQEHFMAPLP